MLHNQYLQRLKKERCDRLGYTGEDRRAASQAVSVEAAALLILGDAATPATRANLIAELLARPRLGKPHDLLKQITERLNPPVAAPESTTTAAKPTFLSLQELLVTLKKALSPDQNRDVIDAMTNALQLSPWWEIQEKLDEQGEALAQFQQHLLAWQLTQAYACLRGYPVAMKEPVQLIAQFAKYRLADIAHARIRGMTTLIKAPFSMSLAGEQRWPSSGQWLLGHIAGPAGVLQRFADAAIDPRYAVGDDQARRLAVQDGLLPKAQAAEIFDLAQALAIRLRILGRPGRSKKLLQSLQYGADVWKPAAALVKGDMRQGGLDTEEPIERQLGLTSAELLCFVGQELLCACDRVDRWLAGVSGSGRTRSVDRMPSIQQVGVMGNILSAGSAYRYASGTRNKPVDFAEQFDPAAKPMRAPTKSMRAKLQDRSLAERLTRSFGIDAAAVLP